MITDAFKALRPKITQVEAAKRAGVGVSWWNRVVAGGVFQHGVWAPTKANPDVLARMAYVVGVTPDQLRSVDRPDAAEELLHLQLEAKHEGKSTGQIVSEAEDLLEELKSVVRRHRPDLPEDKQAIVDRMAETLSDLVNAFDEHAVERRKDRDASRDKAVISNGDNGSD